MTLENGAGAMTSRKRMQLLLAAKDGGPIECSRIWDWRCKRERWHRWPRRDQAAEDVVVVIVVASADGLGADIIIVRSSRPAERCLPCLSCRELRWIHHYCVAHVATAALLLS